MGTDNAFLFCSFQCCHLPSISFYLQLTRIFRKETTKRKKAWEMVLLVKMKKKTMKMAMKNLMLQSMI